MFKHQRSAAFVAASSLFFLLHLASGVTEFYWDSGNYWTLARLEFPPGAIRGYFYPLLLAPARFLSGSNLLPYKVLSSLIYSYGLAVLLPDFYVSTFGGCLSVWRRLIVPALVAALFPGLILYPLSDLPAILLTVGALYCAKRSAAADSMAWRGALLVLGGLLAYGAYNTRPILLFSLALIALAVPFVVYRGDSWRGRGVSASLFLVGVAIAAAPQSAINLKTHGSFSPAVINGDLFARQLAWGIRIQRHESSIDAGSRFYIDRTGERLLREGQPSGIWDYLALVSKHPATFAGIYGRHFLNGLDVRDGEVYVRAQSKDKIFRAILNFLIVFAGLTVAIMGASFSDRKSLAVHLVFGAVLLLPVVAIVPGAIETRFFLPLHLAIYCALAFTANLGALRRLTSRQWLIVGLAFVASACVFASVTAATMANLQNGFRIN